jgi:hypothetical protein
MSCYFRHMDEIFAAAGIQVTPVNRKQIDQAIHRLVDIEYKNCPRAWKAVKAGTATPQQKEEFIRKLKSSVGAE